MFPDVSCTIGGMAGDEWKRLAALVTRRRTDLGMHTREALAKATGLSARMLGDIERARRTNFDPGALARIEQALQWQPGSIEAVVQGGEPTPIQPPAVESTRGLGESAFHGLIEGRTRLLIDLAIEADAVDSSASNLNTDITDMGGAEKLVDDVESLLIDIDRLTQLINDEARSWIGDFDAVRALKADTIRQRRLRRLGRADVGPDLIARMTDIAREVQKAGMGEAELARRLIAEANDSAARFSDPETFEELTKENQDAVSTDPTTQSHASAEAGKVEEAKLSDNPQVSAAGADLLDSVADVSNALGAEVEDGDERREEPR